MSEETTNEDGVNVHKNFTFSEDPYEFDIDKNGFPALTTKNVVLIEFIIKHDSNYRPLDEEGDDSISLTIKNNYPHDIQKIVNEIDKSNSTHLASLGKGRKVDDTPEQHDGRIITANYIVGIKNFEERLAKRDLNLVRDIAVHDSSFCYTLSFASKYCTYMARALFKGKSEADNYCIFDKVICDILPYYAWVYLGEKHTRPLRTKSKRDNTDQNDSTAETKIISTIKEEFGARNGKQSYSDYCRLIDDIRDKSKELSRDGYHISRKDFDHLLWYYFKGNNPKVLEAIKLVGDDKARLT